MVLAAAQTAHKKARERRLAQSAAKSSTARTSTASTLLHDETRNESSDRGPADFSGHRVSTAVVEVDVSVVAKLSKDGGSGDIDRCNDSSIGGIVISAGIGSSKTPTAARRDTAGIEDEMPPNTHPRLARPATSFSSTPYENNGSSDGLKRTFAPLTTSLDSEPRQQGCGDQQGSVDRQNGLRPGNTSIQPEVEVTADGGDLKLVQGRAQTESQADVADAERDEPELAPRACPALRVTGGFAASSVGATVKSESEPLLSNGGVPGGVCSNKIAGDEYGKIESVTGSDSASLVAIETVSPSNVVTGSNSVIAGSRSDNTGDTDALAVNAATEDGGGTDNEGGGGGVDKGPQVWGGPKNEEGGAVDNVPVFRARLTVSEVYAEENFSGRMHGAKRGAATTTKGCSAATMSNSPAATGGSFRTAGTEAGGQRQQRMLGLVFEERQQAGR